MSSESQAKPPVPRRDARAATWLTTLAVAFLLGQMCGAPAGVQGDVRKQTEAQAFKSGAARNEPLLQEIATTLKQIDARLERFEKRLDKKGPAAGN